MSPDPIRLIRNPILAVRRPEDLLLDFKHTALEAEIKRLKVLLAWCKHTLEDQRSFWAVTINSTTPEIGYDEAKRLLSRLNGLLANLEKEELP